mmetsp:Transcript_9149/g.22749  ORF Transcript_9149/g.22749 Transcript_9149/m.22749 type:complete len:713 (-) Transcript_9149:1248-3386(-)
MRTVHSSLRISMVAPDSACRLLIVAPPRPMICEICRCATSISRIAPNSSDSSSRSSSAFRTHSFRPKTRSRPRSRSRSKVAPEVCCSRLMVAPALPMITGIICPLTSRTCSSMSSSTSSAACIRTTASARPCSRSCIAALSASSAHSCVSCSLRSSGSRSLPLVRSSLSACAPLRGSTSAQRSASASTACSLVFALLTASSVPLSSSTPPPRGAASTPSKMFLVRSTHARAYASSASCSVSSTRAWRRTKPPTTAAAASTAAAGPESTTSPSACRTSSPGCGGTSVRSCGLSSGATSGGKGTRASAARWAESHAAAAAAAAGRARVAPETITAAGSCCMATRRGSQADCRSARAAGDERSSAACVSPHGTEEWEKRSAASSSCSSTRASMVSSPRKTTTPLVGEKVTRTAFCCCSDSRGVAPSASRQSQESSSASSSVNSSVSVACSRSIRRTSAAAASTNFLRPRSDMELEMPKKEPEPTISLASDCPGSSTCTWKSASSATRLAALLPSSTSTACHGNTTDSTHGLFAAMASRISCFASATARRLPLILSFDSGSTSIAAPVFARMRLISSPPLPMSCGIIRGSTEISSRASALYCSTASSAALALRTCSVLPLMVTRCVPPASSGRFSISSDTPVSRWMALIVMPPFPNSMPTCWLSTSSCSSTLRSISISLPRASTARLTPSTLPRTCIRHCTTPPLPSALALAATSR